ncbi:MAG: ParA family protein [Taibaiella sp.]|nr:ParA family protein [Taibaiella sp.]
MTNIITFFNHKGGVGKTTILYHLAWKFSQNGHKVLMVDADSQCNLSTLSLGEEAFASHYENHPTDNIKSGLAPAFEARPKLIEAISCPVVGNNPNLFLLPGSFELTEYETQLSVAVNFNLTFLTMTNLPGSFYKLISECADNYEIDYVFIDLNPGLSSINQTLLFSSNYFIIPCGVDYFSKQAIKSLSQVLPNWANWYNKAKDHFKDSVYPLPDFQLKFLGYTVNNFNTKYKKPARAVQAMIDDLDEEIQQSLIPSLAKNSIVLPVTDSNYRLSNIKSFNTLQQISHRVCKPIFCLTAEDTNNTGNVRDNQEMSIEDVDILFNEFYQKVIKLINANGKQ